MVKFAFNKALRMEVTRQVKRVSFMLPYLELYVINYKPRSCL